MPPLMFYALLTPLLIPIYHLYLSLSIAGAFRTASSLHSIRDLNPLIQEKFRIKEIHGSEDMALHEPSGKLIFLGQDRLEGRFGWFPPGGNCKDAADGQVARGLMWMVDPKTKEQNWKPVELPIRGFDGPFVTHGIGLYTPSGSASSTTAYLHAVNHPVHPHLSHRTDDSCGNDAAPAADSRIEVFKLNLDESCPSFGATHLRTIIHPLIQTPNDILSLGPSEFVVTNDHSYRSGWKRGLEDVVTWKRCNRGTLIHVKAGLASSDEVEARVILDGQHNPNGLGPGRHAEEVLLNSASAGVLTLLDLSTDQAGSRQLALNSSVQVSTAIDNPFVLVDPYATRNNDISAYVLGGLLRGIDLAPQANNPEHRHPWTVHLARKRRDGRGWDKKQIVQDNGEFINTIASAMLIPIEPAGDGRREAWLVVTGFFSKGVGVVRVDLTDWAKV